MARIKLKTRHASSPYPRHPRHPRLKRSYPGSVERLARAAEDVFDFVPDEFFHFVSRGAEIFARIELLRIFGERLSDGGGHGHAKIGVDVHLGATDSPGDFDVGFGH